MTTTTTYRDQHAPASAGFFVLDKMPAEVAGANAEQLRRVHVNMTKAALQATAEEKAIAAAMYRDIRNKAAAGFVAVGVVDEAMAVAMADSRKGKHL